MEILKTPVRFVLGLECMRSVNSWVLQSLYTFQ